METFRQYTANKDCLTNRDINQSYLANERARLNRKEDTDADWVAYGGVQSGELCLRVDKPTIDACACNLLVILDVCCTCQG
ncbi:hypothetical protein SLA2020_482990 [Shorea laevis]